MNIFDIFQLTGGIILTFGYIPQIVQILKTKSVKDLNITTFASVVLGILLMELYACNLYFYKGSGFMFLITNTMALTCASTVLILIVVYRDRGKRRISVKA